MHLLALGGGSSYASLNLINKIKKNPIRKECKRIETLLHSETQAENLNSMYKQMKQKKRFFQKYRIRVTERFKKSFYHLRDITLKDTDTKEELPVHIIMGTGDYTKTKTQECKKKITRLASCRANQTRLGGNFSRPGKYCNKFAVFKNNCYDFTIFKNWLRKSLQFGCSWH